MKKRLINKQKKKIAEDCWDLDLAFYDWLQPRLKCYLKESAGVIDLEYYKFNYKDKVMTQKEIIERMIWLLSQLEVCKNVIFDYDPVLEYQKELLELWALVFPVMWW